MNDLLRYTGSFLLYLFFQVFLFNYLSLLQIAVPFVFILFLITLPFNLPTVATLALAFFTGLLVDIHSDGGTGLHAFSCVAMMAVRGGLTDLISSSNYRNRAEITFSVQSPIWLVSLLLPLIFIHHSLYFFLEAFSLKDFFFTLLQVITSTLYTFFFSYILCYLFYKR
ncbi:MAG: hypothetical protein EAZ89_07800 [Bacteroidetes bacterium]|nr:MAG: hypothetical protein EAZ89_07800 [Bacteroidota bacterium]